MKLLFQILFAGNYIMALVVYFWGDQDKIFISVAACLMCLYMMVMDKEDKK